MKSSVKSSREIEIMREGGRRLSNILRTVSERVVSGVRADELNELAESLIRAGGDRPAFLHYKPDFASKPFPATLCVSVNDEIVHGIPSDRVLKEEDIVGLDLGLEHEGLFTDMAVTVAIGKISDADNKLMQITREALTSAIAVVKGGVPVGEIGKAIDKVVRPAGFAIVTELGGHGVGHAIHEPPFISHSAQPDKSGNTGNNKGEKLEIGQTIAIEPMINAGGPDVIFDEKDGYTVRTADKSNSAHYEVTLAITEKGADVLTPIFW
ncbi:MAG: type I methionyl aminopeptidase [Patescibacteria group bacterium]|mgnify:FL=1